MKLFNKGHIQQSFMLTNNIFSLLIVLLIYCVNTVINSQCFNIIYLYKVRIEKQESFAKFSNYMSYLMPQPPILFLKQITENTTRNIYKIRFNLKKDIRFSLLKEIRKTRRNPIRYLRTPNGLKYLPDQFLYAFFRGNERIGTRQMSLVEIKRTNEEEMMCILKYMLFCPFYKRNNNNNHCKF